jgi:hypothetical protein
MAIFMVDWFCAVKWGARGTASIEAITPNGRFTDSVPAELLHGRHSRFAPRRFALAKGSVGKLYSAFGRSRAWRRANPMHRYTLVSKHNVFVTFHGPTQVRMLNQFLVLKRTPARGKFAASQK